MDGRQRWQALQKHLAASRALLDQRNFGAALEAVDAALAIDPYFLAAQSLRDRIIAVAPNLSIGEAYIAPAPASASAPWSALDEFVAEPIVPAAAESIPDLPLANEAPPHTTPEIPLAADARLSAAVPMSDHGDELRGDDPRAHASPASFSRTSLEIPAAAPPMPGTSDESRSVPVVAVSADAALGSLPTSKRADAVDRGPQVTDTPAGPARPPLVSQEGYAQFEQRARRRRADRRLDTARSALAQGRLKEAASALDEVIELDPNLPELRELKAQYELLRRRTSRPRAGRWLAAAAAFGGVVLGATWLQDTTGLWSRQTIALSSLVVPPETFAATVSASAPDVEPDVPVETTGVANAVVQSPRPRPVSVAPEVMTADRQLDAPAAAPRSPEPAFTVASAPESVPLPPPEPVSRPAPESRGPLGPLAASTSAPMPPPVLAASAGPTAASVAKAPDPLVRTTDDDSLIKQVLQRYRSAYEGLDARSAHDVWPAVNETALARAFDGLESQTLTFEACDVRLRGDAAAATCRGSARYVPKVGSREPRTEPRTWNFTLKKSGSSWTIESARAER